jgi:hypothetical protein
MCLCEYVWNSIKVLSVERKVEFSKA